MARKQTSVRGAARDARADDAKARADKRSATAVDSFLNIAHKLGIGADNPTTFSTYGFNPITRNRILLEWIHRGSWVGGLAVDIVASDMVRRGAEIKTEIRPEDGEKIERDITERGAWDAIHETIQWGRLYGGALAVALIDGQDTREPLRLETVAHGQWRGLLSLDRWMVEPSLEDVVDELGPHLGLPRYYRVLPNAPALRGCVIHHSRVLVRHVGVRLPYQQRLQEQLWGLSVLERLYDRMLAFDSATTGAAQLVYRSYLRTLGVEGLREIAAGSAQAMDGLARYVDMMRRFSTIEGITLIDANDRLEAQSHQAFSGLADALVHFGQQLSGALQIPLVRLFGQSPAGLNSTGESDLRMYYDNIRQQQQKDLGTGITLVYALAARSCGIELPPGFAVDFRSLRELDDTEKSGVAQTTTNAVVGAYEAGLVDVPTAMRELRQSSRTTGVFTNVTRDAIEKAQALQDLPPMPNTEALLGGAMGSQPGPQGAPGGQEGA